MPAKFVIRADAGKPSIDHSLAIHTDHWSGLQVLTEAFPARPWFALDGIADHSTQ